MIIKVEKAFKWWNSQLSPTSSSVSGILKLWKPHSIIIQLDELLRKLVFNRKHCTHVSVPLDWRPCSVYASKTTIFWNDWDNFSCFCCSNISQVGNSPSAHHQDQQAHRTLPCLSTIILNNWHLCLMTFHLFQIGRNERKNRIAQKWERSQCACYVPCVRNNGNTFTICWDHRIG